MLYEYGAQKKSLDATWVQDVSCMQHLHYNIEIVLVRSGILNMTLHDVPLILKAGDAVLIAPNTLHSFTCQEPHTICILEYPPDYTPQLFDMLKSHQVNNPVIHIHNALLSYLWYMLPFSWNQEHLPLIRAQAILMPLCDAFTSNCIFTPVDKQHADLFVNAIRLVSYNFQKPITLNEIATQIGVSRETLIRLFRRHTGSTFWDYVLTLRTMYATTLICRGKTITEAAYDAGFGSIRSFNRVFHDKLGMTPTAYMQQERKGDSYLYSPESLWHQMSEGIVEQAGL